MYYMYISEQKVDGCEIYVSKTTYRNIFNTKFNIGFHKRIKDRCNVCASFQNKFSMQTEDEDYKKAHSHEGRQQKFKN